MSQIRKLRQRETKLWPKVTRQVRVALDFLIISWADGDPPVPSCSGCWSGSVVGELPPVHPQVPSRPTQMGILALSKKPSHWPWSHSEWACCQFHSSCCPQSPPGWNSYKAPPLLLPCWRMALRKPLSSPPPSIMVSLPRRATEPRAHSQRGGRRL